MAVAYFMVHFPKSFWPVVNMGEGAILFCFIFLYLAAAGPGAWSIDGARTEERADQVTFARVLKRGWSHSRVSRMSARISAARTISAKRVVERREAEAHQVGRAEIADHAARDQRLHDRIAFGVGEDDVAAALRRVARARRGGLRRRSAPRPRR